MLVALAAWQQPSLVTQALLQLADEVIRIVLSITVRKLETELSVSKGNVNNITDTLGCSTVRVQWVPLSLNVKNSENSENLATSGRQIQECKFL